MGMYASVRGWLEASHDLIRVSCRTPHQMTLANALCRAWEERGWPGGTGRLCDTGQNGCLLAG